MHCTTSTQSLLLSWTSLLVLLIATTTTNAHEPRLYEFGEKLNVQCKNKNGEWGPPPTCVESGEALAWYFGVDTFVHCGLNIESEETYRWFSSLVDLNEVWTCRVAVVPDHDFYIPMFIPLWGVNEGSHLHINNHMNFVFHGEAGRVIGASIYPVRDRFQYTTPGLLIAIHGPSKWFLQHSFKDYSYSYSFGDSWLGDLGMILLWCLVSIVITTLGLGLCYRFHLRPRLIRKMLKRD
eukprot:TRINITY_DN1529_c0_g1_i1.p1 TRINITY_DN1529_c0_g1~~TRINITY_DN1529_c0_g1_i1.p1  ORF type:complete len:237 (+),score=31.50 TRINITY_DN1529_c0_g1_i1:73-783(+)